MTKVTNIDRATLTKKIRPALEKKLAELSREFGIEFKTGSGSYGGNTGHLKVEFATIAEDGHVMTPERDAFIKYHDMYGMPKEALDAEIEVGGHKVRIAGIKTKARKNNVLLDLLDGTGRQLVAPDSSVLAHYRMQHSEQNKVG
jgi:hypothetical protein